MTNERRKDRRHGYFLERTWDGSTSANRLSDLILGGCYVDSRNHPSVGEAVTLIVTLDSEPTRLPRKVVYAHKGMGFALEFTGLDEPTRERLRIILSSMPG